MYKGRSRYQYVAVPVGVIARRCTMAYMCTRVYRRGSLVCMCRMSIRITHLSGDVGGAEARHSVAARCSEYVSLRRLGMSGLRLPPWLCQASADPACGSRTPTPHISHYPPITSTACQALPGHLVIPGASAGGGTPRAHVAGGRQRQPARWPGHGQGLENGGRAAPAAARPRSPDDGLHGWPWHGPA